MPDLPGMSQCVDTPSDVGLEMDSADGMGIVSLAADAFIDLKPEERVLAYHLSQAAVDAEPAIWDQRSPHGKKLRNLAVQLALHRSSLPEAMRPRVETFVRRLFVHKGVFDVWTGERIRVPFDEAEFRDVLAAARDGGAELPEDIAKRLGPFLFDPDQAPSARRADTSGHLARVAASLRKAAERAEGDEKRAIESLAAHLSSPGGEAFQRHLEASGEGVPLVARMGILSRRGPDNEVWAGLAIPDTQTTSHIGRLGPAWTGLAAAKGLAPDNPGAMFVRAGIPLAFTAAASPATPPASVLRGTSGPASVWIWTPVLDAHVKLQELAIKKGFIPDPARSKVFERCLPHAYRARVMLRAAAAASHPSPPNVPTGSALDVVERARDFVAATMASRDPKIVEIGVLPDAACAEVVEDLLSADLLARIGHVDEGRALVDPEIRAAALVSSHALDKGGLRESTRDGHVHLPMVNRGEFRASLESLRDALRGIDDEAKAAAWLGKHAPSLPMHWRKSAATRVHEAGLPARLVFVAPRVKPIRDADGAITDATIVDSLGVIETALVDAGELDLP